MIVHFLDVSFALPSGWGLNTPIQGSPQEGCLQAAEPSPDTPSWFGCAGVWVRPSTGDPTQLSGPSGDPGQFWFMSTGVLPCPYPSSPPGDVVGTPGTLVDHGDRTVGGVLYRWYEWSDTCSLDTTPGTPVTFDAQVWWLPSAGIAFSDVVRHPEVIGILGSVRVDLSATGSETTTTTTINPDITHPTSGVEFRSPTANIHCEINYGPPLPPQSGILLHRRAAPIGDPIGRWDVLHLRWSDVRGDRGWVRSNSLRPADQPGTIPVYLLHRRNHPLPVEKGSRSSAGRWPLPRSTTSDLERFPSSTPLLPER